MAQPNFACFSETLYRLNAFQKEHFTIARCSLSLSLIHRKFICFYPFRIINPIRDCTLCSGSYIQIRFRDNNGWCICMSSGGLRTELCIRFIVIRHIFDIVKMPTNKTEHVTKWHFVKFYFPCICRFAIRARTYVLHTHTGQTRSPKPTYRKSNTHIYVCITQLTLSIELISNEMRKKNHK